MEPPIETPGTTSTPARVAASPGSGVLVHVGLHKTGSSWLQRRLFAGETGHGFACPFSVDAIARILVDPHPFEFDPADAWASLEAGVLRVSGEGSVPVLSCEELSGNPQSGGYSSRLVAKRLAKVVPGARILLVIREQEAMIRSAYKQYVRMGGVASLDRYLHPVARGPRVPRFRFEHFEYHHLIECHRELFGAERVLVLPMERLASDPRGFVEAVARFAGVPSPTGIDGTPEYRSRDAVTVALQRRLNRLFGYGSVNPGAPFHSWRLHRWYDRIGRITPGWASRAFEDRLHRRIGAEVGERYVRSNRLVAEMTGIDLGGLGYRMTLGAGDVS